MSRINKSENKEAVQLVMLAAFLFGAERASRYGF